MIRIMHVRRFDCDWPVYDAPKYALAKGGLTVVADFHAAVVGVARCSDRDNYCKRTGRVLALKRLEHGIRWPSSRLSKDRVEQIGELTYVLPSGRSCDGLFKAVSELSRMHDEAVKRGRE